MKTKLELVNIHVLNVGYARITQEWGGRDFSSPFSRLYYVVDGRAVIHLPDRDIDMKPGYMYLIPSFIPHSYVCEPGFQFYYLFVYERYGETSDVFDLYSFPYEVKANQAADLLFQNYCNLYPELSLPYNSAEDFYSHPAYRDYAVRYYKMDRFEKMQLQGFVWIVVSYFMKHAQKRIDELDKRLMKVMSYIKEHVGQEINLDMLADLACVTKAHLGRLFREGLGISPIQYVIRTRIQSAQRLLMTTGYSVRTIASEVGFNDVSYFIRIFKQNIGFTPQDYRESLKY